MNIDWLDDNLMRQLPDNVINHINLLERMRKDFVANVSHELRTPLTVIIGYLETLLEQQQHGDNNEQIYQKCLQQTLRMQNIIEDLLTLSEIESNESIPLSKQSVDVAATLTSILTSAQALTEEKKQTLRFDINNDLTIAGNQNELHSLFSNLIFNAIKYTPEGGEIIIRWYRHQNQAIFSVKDTGIGIAAKHIPRLTERFYRVDKSRSRASGGTGLGLAICKHILIRHQASLNIDSQEGKGSTFICRFGN